MRRPRRDTTIAAALAAGLLVAYHANGSFLPGHDAVPNVHLPLQILRHGRLSFTPDDAPFMFTWTLTQGDRTLDGRFGPAATESTAQRQRDDLVARGLLHVNAPDYYLVPSVDPAARGWVGIYGPGAGLVALPVVAFLSLAGGDRGGDGPALWYRAKLVASFCVAGSAAIVFLALRGFLSPGEALAVALAYGLGTCVWSVSSQALWQSTPVLLFTALAAWLLLDAERSSAHAAGAGLAAACAVVCRPTAAVVLLAIGVHLLAAVPRGPRATWRSVAAYALGAVPPLALFGWWNAYYLGSPLTFGQQLAGRSVAQATLGIDDPWAGSFVEGFLGQLLSPSRGLLVYSPILLAGFAGIVATWRDPRWRPLRPLGVAAIVTLIAQAKWFDWHGGHSFGYRLVVDIAPLLALASAAVVPALRARPALVALAGAALAWSIGVQVVGAWAYDVVGWNLRLGWVAERPDAPPIRLFDRDAAVRVAGNDGRVRPIRMDVNRPEFRFRLWSLADSPLVYYVTHFDECRRRRARIVANWPLRYQIDPTTPKE